MIKTDLHDKLLDIIQATNNRFNNNRKSKHIKNQDGLKQMIEFFFLYKTFNYKAIRLTLVDKHHLNHVESREHSQDDNDFIPLKCLLLNRMKMLIAVCRY